MKDDKDGKYEFNKKYITAAIYIVIAIIIAVVVIFLLIGARDFFVNGQCAGVFKAFTPFTIGFVIAYLLNPLLLFFENRVFANIGKKKEKPEHKKKKLKHALSLLSTYALTALLITLLMLMVVPQVGDSVRQLAEIVTDLFSPYEYEEQILDFDADDFEDIDYIEDNPINVLDIDIELDRNSLADSKIGVYVSDFTASLQGYIDSLGIQIDVEEKFSDFFLNFTANILDLAIDYVEPAFNATASLLVVTASWIINILLGIFISIYMLVSKDKLIAQVKKLLYAILPELFSNKAISITRKTHEIFGGFLTGKMLESFIVGVICFVCMSIFSIEFAMLISIIVGITNMIPFFGPFIGAIPSIFFLLIYAPWQAVWFAVFILILQQFDGNYLGPKILGSTIGLSPFWIIFSVLVMNGLFGIFGMFVGVPLFAIIYTLVKEFAEGRLDKKGLPTETDAYIFVKSESNPIGIKNKREQQGQDGQQENIFGKIENFSKKVIKYIYKNKDKDNADEENDDE